MPGIASNLWKLGEARKEPVLEGVQSCGRLAPGPRDPRLRGHTLAKPRSVALWNCNPMKSSSLVPANVTGFRKGVFANIIKDVRMRPSWTYLQWAVNPMTSVLTREKRGTHREKARWPHGVRGQDDASTGRGVPKLVATARSWEGGQRRSSQEPPGEQPCQHPDRRPPACRMDSWDLHQSVVISYGSPLENEYQLWGLASCLSCREEMDPHGVPDRASPPSHLSSTHPGGAQGSSGS